MLSSSASPDEASEIYALRIRELVSKNEDIEGAKKAIQIIVFIINHIESITSSRPADQYCLPEALAQSPSLSYLEQYSKKLNFFRINIESSQNYKEGCETHIHFTCSQNYLEIRTPLKNRLLVFLEHFYFFIPNETLSLLGLPNVLLDIIRGYASYNGIRLSIAASPFSVNFIRASWKMAARPYFLS
ncbi:MAG: hypothetical protein K0S27_1482, partial [Gammaproteobacteria bacterium]|nr:hypothetical protein [Gammaproteobacteria bacterium]